MEDKIFKNDAKSITDMAFNNKLFKDELTRDDFNAFEDLIEYLLRTRYESYIRINKLTERIKKAE